MSEVLSTTKSNIQAEIWSHGGI